VTGGVFISYRREDSGGFAGRIYDRLASRLGRENVFFDVDTIPPGRDFVDVLSERVGKCDALLVVIGKHWVSSADSENHRRLDDPHDFVRVEIEAALSRDVPVIPVLVDGAAMPHPNDLPDGLAKLIRRQAVEVSHARFDSDAERLTQALAQLEEGMRQREAKPPPPQAAGSKAPPMGPAAATARAANRAPGPSEPALPERPGGRRLLVYAAVLGLIGAGAAGLLFAPPGSRTLENVDMGSIGSPTPAATGLIKTAAASICDKVKDITGTNADVLIRGAVKSELGGLLEKMADAGFATGLIGPDTFDGLTGETIALAGDQECRTRLFPKMVAALSAPSTAVNINSGNCSMAVNGNASGNSVSCGAPSGAKQ
jgi:hypothetical protein